MILYHYNRPGHVDDDGELVPYSGFQLDDDAINVTVQRGGAAVVDASPDEAKP